MRLRDLQGPVAASAFAGLLGAGVVDGALTLARSGGAAPPLALAALAVGLYGAAGIVAGLALGALASAVRGAMPGGWSGLRNRPERDRAAAAGVLAGVAGVLVVAVGAAVGQRLFISKMASPLLAAIASAGMVVLWAPPAAAIALGLRAPLARLCARLFPRSPRTSVTGLVLLLLLGAGMLAGVAALSRADWRVLDLGPLGALAVAGALGAAHWIFWHVTVRGIVLRYRTPDRPIKAAVVVLVVLALVFAARTPESSAVYRAVADGSLGLRFGVQLARGMTDRDGDGFSARFGGGDCDDTRPDVYPGAEDTPGDGIDQNCEGGDAVAAADDSDSDSDAEAADHGEKTPTPTPTPTPTTPTSAPETGAAPHAAAGPWKGNVLIITIDAFRGDRLGVAGYGRPPGKSLTPALDALAHRGAYFRRVWSQAPNTPRSFPSILTSRYPSDIAWDKPKVNYPNLLPTNTTVFEGLAATGLRPIGIFSHFYFTPDRGISKAFAEWSNDGAGTISESNKDIASPRIVPRVIDRLRKAAAHHERFVMWTHLFEPHSSYMTHREFPTSQSGVPGLMEKYDYEIAFVDLWVKKLLDTVKSLGLADTTAVVVMADHGEAWGEHKAYFHGQDLFDEQLRVPLIIAVPGQAPQVINDDVALVDVAPTLLELVGAPIPKSFRGHSLLPRIEGQERPVRPIFSELLPATAWPHHAVMMIDGKNKLIHRVSDRRYELYDLAKDPGEQKNLADGAGAAHETFEAMRAKLLSFEERKR